MLCIREDRAEDECWGAGVQFKEGDQGKTCDIGHLSSREGDRELSMQESGAVFL